VILDVGSLATAAGVGTAVVQLWMSRRQALTAFEDSMTNQYRAIAAELPVDVFLNRPVPAEELATHRSAFYRYFDLCNEQVFLRSVGRVSRQTWTQWRDGIRQNLSRSAFRESWKQHFDQETDADFDELRRLMANYDIDPIDW
jgi:hypothetical protein